MKIYVETYGCSENIHESEIIKGILQKSGFDIINSEENAEIIIVNSCIVKAVTEQKLLSRLEDLRKIYPDKKLIVTGCAPEVISGKLLNIGDINLVGTGHIKEIAQAVRKIIDGKQVELLGETPAVKLCLPKIRENPIIGIVPISSGCNGSCKYCATRIAKGSLFSYPKPKIIEEIRSAVSSGCKEIWLTAQDTGAYGIDKYGKTTLPELLNDIAGIDGKFSVRIGMMNPNNIRTRLSDLINSFNSKKIYKFIHLPVQSGSDVVLKNMNRFYTSQEFIDITETFRGAFRCTMWTDMIVGYPGETEEQFKESLNLIKKIEPDWVNISRFAKREGTDAAKLRQLDTEEMKRRTSMMTDLVTNIALKKNREWIGWEGDILITERGKRDGQWIGRNFAYKPVVINKSGNLLGETIRVKITDAVPSTLVGWPVKE